MYQDWPNILALSICDYVLLACLLVGLYHWHKPERRLSGFKLGTVLWTQGVLHLTIASVLQMPCTVRLRIQPHPKSGSLTGLFPQVLVMLNLNRKPVPQLLRIERLKDYRSGDELGKLRSHACFMP